MTEQRHKWMSLQLRFVLVTILAVVLGFGSGFGFRVLGERLVERHFMREDVAAARAETVMDDFEDYAARRHLSAYHVDEIAKWVNHRRYLFFMLLDGDTVLLNCGWLNGEEYFANYQEDGEDAAKNDPEPEDYVLPGEALRTIQFSNGRFQVKIYDFSEVPMYRMIRVLSYMVGTLLILTIVVGYHQTVIRKIIQLSQQVEEAARGNVHGEITCTGGDEIGDLARNVSAMRDTVMEVMRAEQEAWNANSDLITRMSHDIRTPLTVLMGFLELLDEGQYSDDLVYLQYLSICRHNAAQLRELADKLFQYFLAFGHRSYEMKPEAVNAKTLLSQMIGEHTILLAEQGWQLRLFPLNRPDELEVQVRVDPVYLKRLFDNLFSNVEKYADFHRPVQVAARLEGEEIHISMKNEVRPDPNRAESTGIGLKTCKRIVQLMGGTFTVRQDRQSFMTDVRLPVWKGEEGTTD